MTIVPRLAAMLALVLGSDAFAAPQMYKCVENGRTVYQQQACNPQPEAAVPTAKAPASAPAAASSAAAKKLRRPSPASSAPATPR